FFWVPRNLASLVHIAAACSRDGHLKLPNWSVAMHLVMIFVHGALFFMICDEFEYIAFLSSSSIPLNASLFTGFVTMQVSLLLINAAWIYLTKRQEARIERAAGVDDDEQVSTGS